MKNIGQQTV